MKKIALSIVSTLTLLHAESAIELQNCAETFSITKHQDFTRYTDATISTPVVAFLSDVNTTHLLHHWYLEDNGTMRVDNNVSAPILLSTEGMSANATLEYGNTLYLSALNAPPYEDLLTRIDVRLAVPSTVISRSKCSVTLSALPQKIRYKNIRMQSSCHINGWQSLQPNESTTFKLPSSHRSLVLSCLVWLHNAYDKGSSKVLGKALNKKKLRIKTDGYIYPPITDGEQYKIKLDTLQKYYYKQ